MKFTIIITLLVAFSSCLMKVSSPNAYYFDSVNGDDGNDGHSSESSFKSLSKLQELKLKPGDKVFLKAGQPFDESLEIRNTHGTSEAPVVISSFDENEASPRARIDAKGFLNGLLIENSSFIEIRNLDITAGPGEEVPSKEKAMRCGVLITSSDPGVYEHIYLTNLRIHDVFYNKPNFQRPVGEVKSANGTQNYGWGIRIMANGEHESYFKDIKIDSSHIENVAHTGIKLTGQIYPKGYSIGSFSLNGNKVIRTGGPGIQMSGVENGHIIGNEVDQSGSNDDSRKWGRGSGLWTWGSDRVLIEKNRFTNANGPGDSAGAHIDYNCSNIVLQYNFSANNAGGFCEILGNNYNCAYRYNISVNDGHRVKGENGAFQEGKIFWLSGYVGNKDRSGPFNSYFYNNTIYVKNAIQTKMAIDRVAKGVLIANNIFHIEGKSKSVLGDQYNPEKEGRSEVSDVFFQNNLFLNESNWPKDLIIQDTHPIYGNVDFANPQGLSLSDFRPKNSELVKDKGVLISKLMQDSIGLVYGLNLTKDILGSEIVGLPDLGAIEIKQ